MNDKERQSAADMKEARAKLLECFPGSFINDREEFIAHPRTNQYFILRDCKTVEAVEAKVLEYLSRPAFKTQPYSQEWRNRRFHEFMLAGVNFSGHRFFRRRYGADLHLYGQWHQARPDAGFYRPRHEHEVA